MINARSARAGPLQRVLGSPEPEMLALVGSHGNDHSRPDRLAMLRTASHAGLTSMLTKIQVGKLTLLQAA